MNFFHHLYFEQIWTKLWHFPTKQSLRHFPILHWFLPLLRLMNQPVKKEICVFILNHIRLKKLKNLYILILIFLRLMYPNIWVNRRKRRGVYLKLHWNLFSSYSWLNVKSSKKICWNIPMYIKSLKCLHLTPVFQLHNFYLGLSTCALISNGQKTILNGRGGGRLKDFWCTNIKKSKIFLKKTKCVHI